MDSLIELVAWAFGGIGASFVIYLLVRHGERSRYDEREVSPGITINTQNWIEAPTTEPLLNAMNLNDYKGEQPLYYRNQLPHLSEDSSQAPIDKLVTQVLRDPSASAGAWVQPGALKNVEINSTISALQPNPPVYKFFESPSLTDAFQFEVDNTELTRWEDGTIALADEHRIMYADPDEGLVVASLQDPTKWNTKLTKRPGKITVEYTRKDDD